MQMNSINLGVASIICIIFRCVCDVWRNNIEIVRGLSCCDMVM